MTDTRVGSQTGTRTDRQTDRRGTKIEITDRQTEKTEQTHRQDRHIVHIDDRFTDRQERDTTGHTARQKRVAYRQETHTNKHRQRTDRQYRCIYI